MKLICRKLNFEGAVIKDLLFLADEIFVQAQRAF
jgi:hypothetical protein